MNRKRFEYFHKDIKQLKIDITMRIIFSVFFIVCFVWQMIAMILASQAGTLTLMQTIVTVIVLVTSMLLCVVTFMYAFKDFRIIAAIKLNGKCVSSVQVLFSVKRTGFLKLYSFLTQFLSLAVTLVLVSSVTYAILQATLLSSVSFYMPLLLTICISSYNSIYHVSDEIRTQKNVHQQSPMY